MSPEDRSPDAIQDQEILKYWRDLGLDYPGNMIARNLDIDQEALGEPDNDS